MVKIFADGNLETLEEDINKWIEEQDGKITIIDRLQSQNDGTLAYSGLIVISVWYNRR